MEILMCSSFERACSSSSIEANRLACPPPANLKQTSFEQCTARVKLVVQQVKLGVLSGRLSNLSSPITTDFPKDPVLTNCGHLFDRIAIQQRKDQGKPCAVCRAPLTQITSFHALREFVEDQLPKDPVLTCSNFKGQNQEHAAKWLELAKSYIDGKDYAEALKCYGKALQYTNASADYAPIPELYDRLREREKATLSRLYLSLYQLQEGKIPEAIKTLESCRRDVLSVSSLIAELKLQFCPFISNVISEKEWAALETINLPPYPQALKDFLAEDCTIWPGKKRSETHIVVPLFPQVAINDVPIPSTLDSLDQLDKISGGLGYRYLWNQIPKNISEEKEFHYAVMTNDVIPGSKNKTYDAQLQLLHPGYEVPGVFDAARAILWENRRSGKRCFNDNPYTFTCCKEVIQGLHLIVGGFNPAGLVVNKYSDPWLIGVAGWRNFRAIGH
jgi:hypothetical protein